METTLMELQILAVLDRQANAFMRPIFVGAIGQAVRSFSDEVNRAAQDNIMYHHPADFSLHHFGAWDDDNGSFTIFPEPRQITLGEHVKQAEKI